MWLYESNASTKHAANFILPGTLSKASRLSSFTDTYESLFILQAHQSIRNLIQTKSVQSSLHSRTQSFTKQRSLFRCRLLLQSCSTDSKLRSQWLVNKCWPAKLQGTTGIYTVLYYQMYTYSQSDSSISLHITVYCICILHYICDFLHLLLLFVCLIIHTNFFTFFYWAFLYWGGSWFYRPMHHVSYCVPEFPPGSIALSIHPSIHPCSRTLWGQHALLIFYWRKLCCVIFCIYAKLNNKGTVVTSWTHLKVSISTKWPDLSSVS